MVPALSVLGESTHDRISPKRLMLRKPELEQRESREYKSFADLFASRTSLKKNQNVPKPSRLLGAYAAGKAPKVVLIGREGRGREAVSTCRAGGQSKVVANSAKNAMCLVWVRDDSKHRQNDRTVLYYWYSRLYYTIIHYNTGLCGQSSTTRVFGLNLKDEYCAVVTHRSSRKTETQPRWRWFLYVRWSTLKLPCCYLVARRVRCIEIF